MKCFACNKPITTEAINPDTPSIDPKGFMVSTTRVIVEVDPECYKKVKAAKNGYQPPLGGPKLYLLGGTAK